MIDFIYGYAEMPKDLTLNGVALPDWIELPEVNRCLNSKYGFYGNYKINGQNRKYLKKGNYVKALVPDGSYQYFEIYKAVTTLESVSVTARHAGYTANKNFIERAFVPAGNGTQIMNALFNNLAFKQDFKYTSNVPTVHQFTVKQTKPIDAIIGSNNGNQNLVGVTGAELEMDNYELKLVKRIGSDNGFRIDFGINLEAIESEVDEESVVNSLYLIGGVPDNDYDDDKEPITYKYLEIKGVTDKTRRISKRENSNCKTVEDLIKWGQTLFDNDRIHEPKATHEVSMVTLEHTIEYEDLYEGLAKLNFGDTAHVYISELGIELQERMVEYTWFPTLGKYKNMVLGNDTSLYTSKVNNETQQLKQKIENRTETLVTNILNATAWITGNSGGHVVFRPEKAPTEILIMDTAKVATAKRVWRWNLNGLGYSSNGVNGPFDIAMTSKGEIVANFIKVGVIQADVFENSFNNTGDIMKMVQGTLQVWNSGKKIMELTKKGLEFWADSKSVGTIGTTSSSGNPFPNVSTPTPIEDNSLVIRTQGDGKYIIISPSHEKGLVMLANGTSIHYGQLNLQEKLLVHGDGEFKKNVTIDGNLKVKGSIDASQITIGGQTVYPGQGGGSGGTGGGDWNGQYPPGITSQADKFAWELWVTLLAKGYSKAAAAGILGNVQGEAGVSMNPDIAQIGGPAYGIVQWDGSAYPLVPPATYDGRTYVQNLMREAGITDDYRTMQAQAKLLDWSMYNGQWIGKVQPATQSAFKVCGDPAQAAYAFESNFERPAMAHSERQGWAIAWYNKFKDLEISSGGDILQTAKSLLSYFTYSMPNRWGFGPVENPNRYGQADCSSFVWLVLTKAGYRTAPRATTWYTGSMTADARGPQNYLQAIPTNQGKVGDIVIVNLGGGAGANGHTAILAEDWRGYGTAIIEMGGMNSGGVGFGNITGSFGYLLNGGDLCIAKAKK